MMLASITPWRRAVLRTAPMREPQVLANGACPCATSVDARVRNLVDRPSDSYIDIVARRGVPRHYVVRSVGAGHVRARRLRNGWGGPLIVKPPAELRVDLARVVKVESAEGEAVVEQHPPIRHIQSRH